MTSGIFCGVIEHLGCLPGAVKETVGKVIPGQYDLLLACHCQHGWWAQL